MQATTVFSRNPYLVSLSILPPDPDTVQRAIYKKEAETFHEILENDGAQGEEGEESSDDGDDQEDEGA